MQRSSVLRKTQSVPVDPTPSTSWRELLYWRPGGNSAPPVKYRAAGRGQGFLSILEALGKKARTCSADPHHHCFERSQFRYEWAMPLLRWTDPTADRSMLIVDRGH